ncbi:MAG: class I SAM-dependent methyltransferase [Chloroflexota bacterium]
MPKLIFACPYCHTPLTINGDTQFDCPHDGLIFKQVEGIWCFLLPGQEEYYAAYFKEAKIVHNTIKTEPDGKSDNHIEKLIQYVLIPLENHSTTPLQILDLGAGTGWLANLLAERGHLVGSLDLLSDSAMGVRAGAQNMSNNPLLQAEFNALPLHDSTIDLVIYHDAFHYSDSYVSTLGEAFRVLKTEGQVVIMGSPYLDNKADGVALINRREAAFETDYGFPRFTLYSEGFLTAQWLESLSDLISIEWKYIVPNNGNFQQKMINYWRKLLGKPLQPIFPLIIGRRDRSAHATKDWSKL